MLKHDEPSEETKAFAREIIHMMGRGARAAERAGLQPEICTLVGRLLVAETLGDETLMRHIVEDVHFTKPLRLVLRDSLNHPRKG